MNLTLSNAIFKVEDLLSGKINQKNFSDRDGYILNFIKKWRTGQIDYQFTTSGSTGTPKNIRLHKDQLRYSSQITLNYLFGKEEPKTLFLCLDPKFIGGTQVIIRALESNADLIVEPPASNPVKALDSPVDLISLVPLQVETILNETPNKFALLKHVLIGGAELNPTVVSRLMKIKSTKFYQTYGMTETASHIAIKLIGEGAYYLMGDVEMGLDKRDCLKIKGTVTSHKWIQTNDLVEIEKNSFQWLGRADWVINSGGIKLSPERIEKILSEHWPDEKLMITSVTDDLLGEKMVMVTQKPMLEDIKKTARLTRFQLPKEEIIIKDWPTTEGEKLDRKEIQQWARSQTDKGSMP